MAHMLVMNEQKGGLDNHGEICYALRNVGDTLYREPKGKEIECLARS